MIEEGEFKFTPEDIVSRRSRNAQFNFMIAYSYLHEKDLSPQDYAEFIGNFAAPAWDRQKGAPLKEIAKNFAAHMACFDAETIKYVDEGGKFTIIVEDWPSKQSLEFFRIPLEVYDAQWDTFKLLAEHIGLSCKWVREQNKLTIVLEN